MNIEKLHTLIVRWTLILLTASCLSLHGKTTLDSTSSSDEKHKVKNLLLIVCDDLNVHLEPMGYSPIVTPTLAKFANEAMTFNRAFCQYPVCGPSRASFLSGLYPESTGILDNDKDIRKERPDTVSLPQFLKENGYWTGGVGKVFHSPRQEGGDVAWNEYHRFENDELAIEREARLKFEAEHGSVKEKKNTKKWKAVREEVVSGIDSQRPPGYGRSGLEDEQHADGKNARQVAKWIKEGSAGEKPFFIACGIHKPHIPHLVPNKYFDMYPTDKIVYTPDSPKLWDNLPSSAAYNGYKAYGFELGVENDARRRMFMQAYHACVSFIDAQIELVFDALKESGHWDDTVVIFMSDHGFHLGDHFMWGKVTLFDIGARVPMIVRVPGVTQNNSKSEAMVELVDIFPTVTELFQLEAPSYLQGVSLLPVLKNASSLGAKDYAYTLVTRGEKLGYALRNQSWRYGSWSDGEELYDLKADPQEKNNLANDSSYSEKLKEFRTLLEEKKKIAASKR